MRQGIFLLNMQMAGLLIGGLVWGIFGDKKGRVQVLFGSILIYSLANLLNAGVTEVWQYAALRLIAGFGLAGEIGAGITLVSEILPKEHRGLGTTLVATIGVMGALVAPFVGEFFPWRMAYIVGGIMGLALLLLRVSVHESGIFGDLRRRDEIHRGNLLMIFTSRVRLGRYLACIGCGVPIWFLVGILVTFSPEVGEALSLEGTPLPGRCVFYSYVGLTLGDLASGLLSQILKSRKRAFSIFVFLTSGCLGAVFFLQGATASDYYLLMGIFGFATGYWAVFVSNAAEQFGTNLRATVATSVPNMVRGTVIIMTSMVEILRVQVEIFAAVMIVGSTACGLALISIYKLHETYGKDLNYVEE